MQASQPSSITGLRGLAMQSSEQQAKPTKEQRAAARNELDRYAPMNWDDAQDSHHELQDPALWVNDASNPTQLQEDIEMLRDAKQQISGAARAD